MASSLDPIAVADSLCELLQGGNQADAACEMVLAAERDGALRQALAAVVAAGCYERLRDLLQLGTACAAALRALAAARPTFGEEALNAAAERAARAAKGRGDYDLLIVPGYTPRDAREPQQLTDVARQRIALAREDFAAGVAPLILVTGGSVYPPGTPYNEALAMREHLLALAVPAAAILVEPYARHSTTNLRNAGRIMRRLGLRRGLIVTGFDNPLFSQAFYFGHPTLSTFHQRCRETLGYTVGELEAVDEHRVAFAPGPDVDRPHYADPLDV